MTKYLKLMIGAVVVAALGWGVLWYVGKGRLDEGIDREVALIEQAGWTIVTGQRRIGGFPLGYRVELDDVSATHGETGILVRLPMIAATGDVLDPSRFAALLPERFTVALPVPEAARGANSPLPRVLNLAGASREFKVTTATAPDGAHTIAATATGLTLTIDQQDYPRTASLVLEGVDAGSTLGHPRSLHRLAARSIVLRMGEGAENRALGLEVSSSRFSATLDTDLATLGGLSAMLYQGESGRFNAAFQTGAVKASVTVRDDPARPSGELALSAASGTGVIAASQGGVDLRSELRDTVWALTPDDDRQPYRGAVFADLAQFAYRVPTAPAVVPKPAALRLALLGIEGDDRLWRLVDPDVVLDRAPANLVVDLEGTLRVTRRLDQLPPNASPPYEVSNISVRELAIEALGATARATGDVEFLQPINQPMGALEVRMSGIRRLIEALGRAGLLKEDVREAVEAMLQVYVRPGGADDAWATDVTFEGGAIMVNGLSVP